MTRDEQLSVNELGLLLREEIKRNDEWRVEDRTWKVTIAEKVRSLEDTRTAAQAVSGDRRRRGDRRFALAIGLSAACATLAAQVVSFSLSHLVH